MPPVIDRRNPPSRIYRRFIPLTYRRIGGNAARVGRAHKYSGTQPRRSRALVGHTGEPERTMAFADIAFGQIRALRQPATPRNFEIWYTYATGYSPSLNQKINEILKEHSSLTDADLEQIYETYLAPAR